MADRESELPVRDRSDRRRTLKRAVAVLVVILILGAVVYQQLLDPDAPVGSVEERHGAER